MSELDRLIAELEARAAVRRLTPAERTKWLSLRTEHALATGRAEKVRCGALLNFLQVSAHCWAAAVEGLETVEVQRLSSGLWHIEPCSLLGYREVIQMSTPFECMDVLELRLAQHAKRAA